LEPHVEPSPSIASEQRVAFYPDPGRRADFISHYFSTMSRSKNQ
jgi:hypothetical protein